MRRIMIQAGIVVLLGLFSLSSSAEAAPTDSCSVCADSYNCVPEDLALYDLRCQTQCGAGSYAGACITDSCSGGNAYKILCYYAA